MRVARTIAICQTALRSEIPKKPFASLKQLGQDITENQKGRFPMMQGKKAFIFGVLNDFSLGWHIANQLHQQGCELAFSHMPGEKFERRVTKAVEPFKPRFLTPCDVTKDEDILSAFRVAGERFGTFDLLVHSLAFAPADTFEKPFLETTRESWKTALDVSAYSLVALSRASLPLMNPRGSILTLTYHAAEKYVPNYNMMAIAKAALECSVRYLAAELGRHPKKIRVNALSAGAIKTLASSGTGDINRMIEHYQEKSPLSWDGEATHVGKAALYLLSDLASGVTGEIHYVDGGYNIVGW
jgi:enoyl-[acyl-carrier protein] reductase I